jgi:putative transposase
MGGYRPILLAQHREFILEQVRQSSHVTARGLQRLLAGRGVTVSHDSVWRFLRREGLSFKNVWPAPLASWILLALFGRAQTYPA